jgi:excisionase family DNA binding protein
VKTVERKTLSIMAACELVGVSRRTVYNWINAGKVEYVRTAGGSVRIFEDTLWREANGARAAAASLQAPANPLRAYTARLRKEAVSHGGARHALLSRVARELDALPATCEYGHLCSANCDTCRRAGRL